MTTSEYIYEFVFNDADISNDDTITPITESNSVIEGYSGHASISGDTAFYVELNRVLSNLHSIRRVQKGISKLASYVVDSNGNTFKVLLI